MARSISMSCGLETIFTDVPERPYPDDAAQDTLMKMGTQASAILLLYR